VLLRKFELASALPVSGPVSSEEAPRL